MRASNFVVANITTLNFNVLFELGYAIGLNKPILPLRDTTYSQDKTLFDQLGIFDVIGYENFQNGRELRSLATKEHSVPIISAKPPDLNRQQPIYYIKSPIDTDGSMKLSTCLKKSAYRFRSFDSRETPRLSFHEAYRQIHTSVSVVAHLIDPDRDNSSVHNGRCAFLCGMAMAAGKQVLMLQEGMVIQPIDYRDVVIPYIAQDTIGLQIEKLVRATADTISFLRHEETPSPKSILENIDLGDAAAENEIQSLSRYFVKTPQYQQAAQGHARLVIGRKGSGKTAIFYALRNSIYHEKDLVVLDLKPEGHQFKKLKEVALQNMSEGVQEHLLTAFWTYLLLLEIMRKLIDMERSNAYSDPKSLEQYKQLTAMYSKYCKDNDGDFSARLMDLVNRVVGSFAMAGQPQTGPDNITHQMYSIEIPELFKVTSQYLGQYKGVWVLFDNIDKGWPTRGAGELDVSILRCLLEASRKLQRIFGERRIDLKSVVFIRKDIYDLLVDQTPDRGKESTANLDWTDVHLIKELLEKRIAKSLRITDKFEDIWAKFFDPHVAGEASFSYILDRTFLRPRDILNFVSKCIQIAVSRGHKRVEQEDILKAEILHSEDMKNELAYEIRDVFPKYPDILHKFIGQSPRLSNEDLSIIMLDAEVADTDMESVKDTLLWFSFLGITHDDEGRYSYQHAYNLPKVKSYLQSPNPHALLYEIHPAFRVALEVK